MIDTILKVCGYIGFGLLLLFATIGFMFVWRAFSFATQLALVEYKYKRLIKASEEAQQSFAQELQKDNEEKDKDKV